MKTSFSMHSRLLKLSFFLLRYGYFKSVLFFPRPGRVGYQYTEQTTFCSFSGRRNASVFLSSGMYFRLNIAAANSRTQNREDIGKPAIPLNFPPHILAWTSWMTLVDSWDLRHHKNRPSNLCF